MKASHPLPGASASQGRPLTGTAQAWRPAPSGAASLLGEFQRCLAAAREPPPRPECQATGSPVKEARKRDDARDERGVPLDPTVSGAGRERLPEVLLATGPPGRSEAALAAHEIQAWAEGMLRAVSLHQLAGQTTVQLEVSTPRLPQLGLELSLEGGRLRAGFRVSHAADQELLRSRVGELQEALAERGLELGTLEVTVEEGGRGTGRREGEQRRAPAEQQVAQEPRRSRGSPISGGGRRRSGIDYVG